MTVPLVFFTSGPRALVMALAKLHPDRATNPIEEFQIWRESNSIYAPAGLPGCGPFGLALAAAKRGAKAEVYDNDIREFYSRANRDLSPEQQAAAAAMNDLDRGECNRENIAVISALPMENQFSQWHGAGRIPIVMNADGYWTIAEKDFIPTLQSAISTVVIG